MGPTLLQSSSLTCRYTRMSSKNDLVGGLTDPFEGLSRTTPLETYRMSTKLGDTSLDTETITGTASGWMGIEDTLVRVDAAREEHESFKADCNTDSQGTECWRETDVLEESDSPRSIDRCVYSHVPMEDVDNEDEKLRMREEPTCTRHGLACVTLV